MGSESLSQSEIDLLFNAGGSPPPVAQRTPQQEVQVYDFRRPNRISKDRLRALDAMYGVLAKSAETWLASRVRGGLELELQAVEQFSFGEFLLSLSSPCASFVYDIEDSGGQQAAVDFGQDFAFFVVDRLLGGTLGPAVQERPLTPLERMIVRLVADRVAGLLVEAWADHVPMSLKLSRFEAVPDMLQIANREDPVLVATVAVRMGDAQSLLLVALPFVVLETFFTTAAGKRIQLGRGSERERKQDRRRIEQSLRQAGVPVRARLPEVQLPVKALAALSVGQVLALPLGSDSPIEVHIAGERRFLGSGGRAGQKLAVRLTGAIEGNGGETRTTKGRNGG
jgi:flagellar motor switch protein FliM